MRYTRSPRFPTRHWAQLWKANVPNVQSLKDHASKSITFVAIDAEPWTLHGAEIAEIGITTLASVDMDCNLIRPTSVDALCKNFTFRCHCFGVSGRQKRRENYWAGEPKLVDAVDVEETIVQVLESIPSFGPTPSGQKHHLCLIGFDLYLEVRILSTLYPRVLQYFSTWVDLQDLVMESASLERRPSMVNSLLAFGFERECAGRSTKVSHNAGNDTLRILVILLNLLNHNSTLVVPQDRPSKGKNIGRSRHYYKLMKDDRFFKDRPRPRRAFPFATRVYLEDHTGPKFSVKKLYDTFIKYNPSAVGAGDVCRKPPAHRGWVCLASLEDHDRFVAEVDGCPCDNGVWEGVWWVKSFYDPSLTPATTAEELKNWLDVQSSARKEEKALSRKQKKETKMKENVDPVDVFAESWVLGEFSELSVT